MIKCVKKWIKKWRPPQTLISDNGTQLVSKKFESFLESNKIKSIHTPMYKLSSNAIAERVNAIIAEILRMYSGENIKKIIQNMHHRPNLNYKRTIRHSPFEKVYKYSFFDPDEHYISVLKDKQLGKKNKNVNKKIIKTNENVCIKKFNAKKSEEQYEGPFTVTEVGKKGRWVKILGRKEWIQVRDIK